MARSRSRSLTPRLGAVAALTLVALGSSAVAADVVDAARRNESSAALAELKGGADVNTRAADGTTALHWAAHHDNVELAAGLIAAGAESKCRQRLWRNPAQRGRRRRQSRGDRATARRGRRCRMRPARMGKPR